MNKLSRGKKLFQTKSVTSLRLPKEDSRILEDHDDSLIGATPPPPPSTSDTLSKKRKLLKKSSAKNLLSNLLTSKKRKIEKQEQQPPPETPPPQPSQPDNLFDDDEEDFLACLDEEDLKPKENKPTVVVKPVEPTETRLTDKYNRHIVSEVISNGLEEITLKTKEGSVIKLRGTWIHTPVKEGDVVNVLDVESNNGEYIIDDLKGLLILNPDHLISGTSVVGSLFCKRKAVLNERFKGVDAGSKTMFIGTVLHELLQIAVKLKVDTLEKIKAIIADDILKMSEIRLDLATLKMTETELYQELDPFIPHIHFFIQKYMLGKQLPYPPPAFASENSRVPKPVDWPGAIQRVQDIEENIWSPRLGLKGKVDLTLQVKLHHRDKQVILIY